MAARKPPRNNNHLEEAMALLIRYQAAFVEQMARSDREFGEWRRESRESQRQNDEQFARLEERLSRIETILVQLPEAIRQKIGFKAQK